MYTDVTYQEFMAADDRPAMLIKVIDSFRGSAEFVRALEADRYFRGETDVMKKLIATIDCTHDAEGKAKAVNKELIGNRISSNFFGRFVIQQNQHLLNDGMQLDSDEEKRKLGTGFDTILQETGENALIQGVCYGFWNFDHLEMIKLAKNPDSGFCALLDEETGDIRAGIQFWRIKHDRPMYVRVFEEDGVSCYTRDKNGCVLTKDKTSYVALKVTSAAYGTETVGGRNYGALPIIPLLANPQGISELTQSLKSKIDLYDTFLSDFRDNLERTNDVYWVINNFGGTSDEIVEMLAEIRRIKATYTAATDGAGSPQATAEPHTIEVPYQARQTALDILRKEMYDDYCALNMSALTGGSLTNVAIEVATTAMDEKSNRYEWRVFEFCQRLLALVGIKTERIKFKRQTIANRSEVVTDIYAMRQDITRRMALKLNPYIDDAEIEQLLIDMDAEDATGLPDARTLSTKLAGLT